MAPTVIPAASRVLPLIPWHGARFRAANWLYRHSHAIGFANVRLRGGARFRLDLSEWPQAQAYMLRVYDPRTVAFCVSCLPSAGGVMVDAGAHVGLITFQVAARRPGTTIHAFEPHPRVAAQFREHMTLNPAALVVLNECGLSSMTDLLLLELNRLALRPDGTHPVETIALDDYLHANRIERVDVLKIDVEGHELPLLSGAARALEAGTIRNVIVELNEMHLGADPDATVRLLHGAGFGECVNQRGDRAFTHAPA